MNEREWWDNEATVDERYATLRWGGDGTPETVDPTIQAILDNIEYVMTKVGGVSRVLDIGCGPGRILHRLARLHPDGEFHGVDISPAMVALGDTDRPDNVRSVGVLSPGAGIPHVDGGYDVVYSTETFQHMTLDWKSWYLAQIASRLSDAGMALIQFVAGDDTDLPANHPIDPKAMEAMARNVGLKVRKFTVPNQIHDEWRWMVLSR